MRRIFIYITEKKYVGRTIKDVLVNKYRMSSGLISSLKKNEYGITVNEKHEFVNYVLKLRDVLKIVIEEGASPNIEPIECPLDIIYEDADILAVNKPYDMPTHTSIGHHSDTLANGILYYLNKNGQKHTFHAVTRLDKDTSGVVLIAKNRYAHDLFSNLLRREKLQKTYTAIVCGKLQGSGTIDAKIKREDESIIKRTVAEDGQEALTHFRALKNSDKYSYVELIPKTGRTHQIRVHMASIGHPLAGDNLYGGDDSSKRQLLHCRSLEFIHPILNKKIRLYAKLPDDFKQFINQKF